MGDFFAEKCLDELFLTLAPQVAGWGDVGFESLIVAPNIAFEAARGGAPIAVIRREEKSGTGSRERDALSIT